jgi:hypothetical protein
LNGCAKLAGFGGCVTGLGRDIDLQQKSHSFLPGSFLVDGIAG